MSPAQAWKDPSRGISIDAITLPTLIITRILNEGVPFFLCIRIGTTPRRIWYLQIPPVSPHQ